MIERALIARALPLLAAGALLAVFPHVGGKFYVDLMLTTMIFAIFALSLELLVGRTGLVSFGHAAFFGIAAYVTALLSPQSEAPSVLWLLPVVLVVTALAALAIGALFASLLVGLVDTFGKVLIPQTAGILVYVLMAAILLWRPEGLFRAG
jgi:ABC-type branched-subunit amino acid transport system permease subunit